MTRARQATTTTAISIADLNTEIDNEPRVLDVVLGERLGFDRPRKVRELIDRNSDELHAYGSLPRHRANPGKQGGRPTQEYYLNEPQALLICMFSNTAKAAEVRRQLIAVFMEYRRGQEKPIKVQAHERRASTKLDNALSLARSADRLEAVIAAMTPRERFLSATVVDGQPIVFDPHDTDYKIGDLVLGFDWDGNLSLNTIDRQDAPQWRPGGPRMQYGAACVEGGIKTTPTFFAVGKVVQQSAPIPPSTPTPIAQNDNLALPNHYRGRRTLYRDEILRLLDTGMSNREIARATGATYQTVTHWRRWKSDQERVAAE